MSFKTPFKEDVDITVYNKAYFWLITLQNKWLEYKITNSFQDKSAGKAVNVTDFTFSTEPSFWLCIIIIYNTYSTYLYKKEKNLC